VLTRAGARSNAYTTDDYTNYHTTFAKEDLAEILAMEADRFQNLDYAEEAFKTESRAVLGEYNKNSAEPLNKIIEVQRDKAFTTHTYKHTTMGFLKDIEDMPNQFAYSKVFFDRWYRPENTTLIVAGDVKPEEVLPLVSKHWGAWKRGTYRAQIPQEPEPKGPPVLAHVPWTAATLPWVTLAFRAPAFSETEKDFAATDLLLDLTFGPTSDLYKRLVEQEQKVDQLFPYLPGTADPGLATVAARLKKSEDAVYVRDEILKALARVVATPVAAARLADARSNARYEFVRRLDNTEAIASTLARYVRYRRSFETLNRFYRVYDSLRPEDLQAAARRYVRDERLVLTTLSQAPLSADVAKLPVLSTFVPEPKKGVLNVVLQKSALPQINLKLLFAAGSAHDPAGKEGLARLAAALVAEGGSKALRIDEIKKALFPMAGGFDAQVDKEMTTFTGVIHKDNVQAFLDVVLPMLTEPGLRAEDFQRIKDHQRNALVQDLRNNNEEELGKERLQTIVFAGTPYGHPALGTIEGIDALTLEDVKAFLGRAYTRAGLTVGLSGDVPEAVVQRLEAELAVLPEGPALPAPIGVRGRRAKGLEVEIIQKETRATAISLGLPIEVTRSHPDFVALSVARAWLGEHRSTQSHLFQRIREVRGMNYGDYAYIEAFPRGMFQFFPDPNLARRAQIFEVWIRPVAPENAHLALRIALFELDKLVEEGLTTEDFEATRRYLMKNVYLQTATQNQQLGAALDSRWYGTDEFTTFMRERLAKLTREDVHQAIKKHLSARDLHVVVVTKDAAALREALIQDAFSPIHYEGDKPKALLDEDQKVGARKLGLRPEAVRITPVDDIFKR